MPILCPWQLYCETEETCKILYAEKGSEPLAVCPTNASHTINESTLYCLDPGDVQTYGVIGNTTNVIEVSKSGSDTPLLNQPYLTIGAALQAAANIPNAIVRIQPGIYDEHSLIIPAGVEVQGMSKQNTKIKHTATTSRTLVKIQNPNVSISNISLELGTSVEGLTLKTVEITSDNSTFTAENCAVAITSTAKTGVHNCIHHSGTDTISDSTKYNIRDSSISNTSSSSTKKGIYSSSGQLRVANSQIFSQGVGTESDGSSTIIEMNGCNVKGGQNDISQTQGSINLNTTTLVNNTTNNTIPSVTVATTNSETYILRDEKTVGSNGGSYDNNNNWVVRTLNVLSKSFGGTSVSLDKNVFTLLPGTYWIETSVPAFGIQTMQSRLFNITNNTVASTGTSENTSSSSVCARSIILVTLNVTTSTQDRIEMRGSSAQSATGMGRPSGFGTEVYTTVKIIRLV